MDQFEQLADAARSFGVELTGPVVDRLRAYHDLLLAWNQRINLISRKDTHRIIPYHFLDSLTAVPLIPSESAVCDLGSGAGLPGLPVRIARDDVAMALVDSTRKKALFLDAVIRQLELTNTTVQNVRAEAIRDQTFDVVLCRLLGSVRDVARYAAQLLKPQGRIILYKSETADAELKQAQPVLTRLHLSVQEIRDYRFAQPAAFIRRLVVVTRNA